MDADWPLDLAAYKRTQVFDQDSLPDGLKRQHSTKAGVWGRLHVLEGTLRFRTREPPAERLLGPGVRAEVLAYEPMEASGGGWTVVDLPFTPKVPAHA